MKLQYIFLRHSDEGSGFSGFSVLGESYSCWQILAELLNTINSIQMKTCMCVCSAEERVLLSKTNAGFFLCTIQPSQQMSLWLSLCLILSVCGGRLVAAIRAVLVKGRSSGDAVYAAAEETTKELKERICRLHQIQKQTNANGSGTGISPARVMYNLSTPASYSSGFCVCPQVHTFTQNPLHLL